MTSQHSAHTALQFPVSSFPLFLRSAILILLPVSHFAVQNTLPACTIEQWCAGTLLHDTAKQTLCPPLIIHHYSPLLEQCTSLTDSCQLRLQKCHPSRGHLGTHLSSNCKKHSVSYALSAGSATVWAHTVLTHFNTNELWNFPVEAY